MLACDIMAITSFPGSFQAFQLQVSCDQKVEEEPENNAIVAHWVFT